MYRLHASKVVEAVNVVMLTQIERIVERGKRMALPVRSGSCEYDGV